MCTLGREGDEVDLCGKPLLLHASSFCRGNDGRLNAFEIQVQSELGGWLPRAIIDSAMTKELCAIVETFMAFMEENHSDA